MDYRDDREKKSIWVLENTENLQKTLDEMFQPGRKYFSDSEYINLPEIFQLFFLLKKTKFISDSAMAILESFSNEPELQVMVNLTTL